MATHSFVEYADAHLILSEIYQSIDEREKTIDLPVERKRCLPPKGAF